MKKLKYIKLKKIDEGIAIITLQEWILKITNVGLISIELHRLCRKFIKDLQKILLSQEMQ